MSGVIAEMVTFDAASEKVQTNRRETISSGEKVRKNFEN
jgi:hypothetical protein